MHTIHYLFTHALKYILVLFVIILLFFMGRVVVQIFPEYSLKNLLNFSDKKETAKEPGTEFYLPTPGSLSLGKAETPTAHTNLYTDQNVFVSTNTYVPNAPYNSGQPQSGQYDYPNYGYSQYASYDITEADGGVFDSTRAGFSSMSAYLRGISLYQGAYIYKNLIFSGEARESMFIEGKFSLYVVNGQGQVIGRGVATALDQWSIPGWHRFTGRIVSMASGSSGNCALIFQQDRPGGLHMLLPVVCR